MNSDKAPLAIITGASSGIGYAFAIEYASRGYQLLVIARDGNKLEELIAECQPAKDGRHIALPLDLTEENSVTKVLACLNQNNLTPEILINNAGIGCFSDFESMEPDDIEQLISLNITTVVRLTRATLPLMHTHGRGHIINVGSVYSFAAVPKQSIYAASKAFLLSFSLALSDEVKMQGIRVTIICPGTVRTNFRKRFPILEYRKRPSMSASTLVKLSMPAIEKGLLLFVPGLLNKAFTLLMRLIPSTLQSRAVSRLVY